METSGRRLKEERQRIGLSQEELAVLVGKTKGTQSRYESESLSPDSGYWAAIAAAGVDVQYVLTGRRSGAVLSPEEESLLAGYRKLDLKGRAGVLALINGLQPAAPAGEVKIKGDVSQVVHGGMTVTTPMNFTINKKTRK